MTSSTTTASPMPLGRMKRRVPALIFFVAAGGGEELGRGGTEGWERSVGAGSFARCAFVGKSDGFAGERDVECGQHAPGDGFAVEELR